MLVYEGDSLIIQKCLDDSTRADTYRVVTIWFGVCKLGVGMNYENLMMAGLVKPS